MDVHELARKINEKISSKVIENGEDWMLLYDTLVDFNKTASSEELFTLRKECPDGEIFCIIATGIQHEKRSQQ